MAKREGFLLTGGAYLRTVSFLASLLTVHGGAD